MTTYAPTGKGLCAVCGRDVGRHVDPAHSPSTAVINGALHPKCGFAECMRPLDDPIHDPGRILRCPQ